jgi:hypothetical protein
MNMNISIRIITLRTWTLPELLHGICLSCLSASSSAIVVELGLERVKVCKPLASTSTVRGWSLRRLPSVQSCTTSCGLQVRSCAASDRGDECLGGCGKMETLGPKRRRSPPFIWCGCASWSWPQNVFSFELQKFPFWTVVNFWLLFSDFIFRKGGIKITPTVAGWALATWWAAGLLAWPGVVMGQKKELKYKGGSN